MTDEQTAVAEAPPPRQTLKVLHALVEVKQQEAETLKQTLGDMWMKRQKGTLPREQYSDYLYYEDQLRVTLQEVARLEPQLRFAEEEDRVTRARAHWDSYCEPVAQQGLRWCQAWQTFLEEGARLEALIDAQADPLVLLTRPDGQPAFHPDSGAVTVQNALSAFPGQVALAQTVIPRLRAPLTVGETRAILEPVKGKAPFEDTNVQSYLALYRVEEAKPEGEEYAGDC